MWLCVEDEWVEGAKLEYHYNMDYVVEIRTEYQSTPEFWSVVLSMADRDVPATIAILDTKEEAQRMVSDVMGAISNGLRYFRARVRGRTYLSKDWD
jgi:hypothetical protein